MRTRPFLGLTVLLALGAVAATQGCAPAAEDADDSASAASTGEALDVGAFVRGLVGPATSPERKAAGAELGRVMGVVDGQIPDATEAREARAQRFTKTVLGYTTEYLKSGAPCDAKQKIRVYRGIGSGSQPILRATSGERQKGLHVAKPMMDAMRSLGVASPAAGAAGMESVNGVALFRALVNEKRPLAMRVDSDPAEASALTQRIVRASEATDTFSKEDDASKKLLADLKTDIQTADFGFSYQFGLRRTFMDFDTGEQRRVELGWSAIADDHTQGAPWGGGGGSPFSPLISTGMNAVEKWGPVFIVADVCPERAIPSSSRVDATEQEVYVPLFVLPEEIITVTTSLDEIRAQAHPAAAERPLDAAYRACFEGTGGSIDDAVAAYDSAVAKGLPLADFRTELTRGMTVACRAPAAATSCPAGCVASSFCKEKVTPGTARMVGDLPCVTNGAPGCKVDACR